MSNKLATKYFVFFLTNDRFFPIPEVIDEDVYSGIGSLKVFSNFSL